MADGNRRTREEVEREIEEASNGLLALEEADPEGKGSPEEDELRDREQALIEELDAILEAEQVMETQEQQEFKLDGRTKRALDTAIAKKQVSQASYKAVVEGRIDLAKAKELGREGSPDTPVGPAPKRVNKNDRSRECMCGCGKTTNGRFAMGHDARIKGWIVKAVREGIFDQLSAEIQGYAVERDLVRQTEARMADEEQKRQEKIAAKAAKQREKEGAAEKK